MIEVFEHSGNCLIQISWSVEYLNILRVRSRGLG